MNEASYTAWDDNLYEWPPPDGWYQADDGKWWPQGYGPRGDRPGDSNGNNGGDDLLSEVERTSIFPAGGSGLIGGSSKDRLLAESQRPVYDELPSIDDVFIDSGAGDDGDRDGGDDLATVDTDDGFEYERLAAGDGDGDGTDNAGVIELGSADLEAAGLRPSDLGSDPSLDGISGLDDLSDLVVDLDGSDDLGVDPGLDGSDGMPAIDLDEVLDDISDSEPGDRLVDGGEVDGGEVDGGDESVDDGTAAEPVHEEVHDEELLEEAVDAPPSADDGAVPRDVPVDDVDAETTQPVTPGVGTAPDAGDATIDGAAEIASDALADPEGAVDATVDIDATLDAATTQPEEANADPTLDTEADVDADLDVDAEADVEADAEADVEADAEADAEALLDVPVADVAAEAPADLTSDADAASEAELAADLAATAATQPTIEVEPTLDIDTELDADAVLDADADADDADADADATFDVDADAELDADVDALHESELAADLAATELLDDGFDGDAEEVELADDAERETFAAAAPAAATVSGFHLGELPVEHGHDVVDDHPVDVDADLDADQLGFDGDLAPDGDDLDAEDAVHDHRHDGEPARSSWPMVGAAAVVGAILVAVLAFVVFGREETTGAFDAQAALAIEGEGSLSEPYPAGSGAIIYYPDAASNAERRWVIQIVEPASDRTEQLVAQRGAATPPDGSILASTTVRVTYREGPTPGPVSHLEMAAIGSSLVLFGDEARCPGVGEQLDQSVDLEPGQAIEGELCWQIPEADLDDLKLSIEAGPVDGMVFVDLG